MAICGKTGTIKVDGATFEAHNFVIDLTADETDVRAFGAPTYGSWLACNRSGTVTAASYADPGVEDGDVADVVCTVGDPVSKTYTMTAAVCTNVNISCDAKGIVEYSSTYRITSYSAA